jgi:hypothetical protein
MSKVRADRYTNRADDGAPTFSQGVNVVGSGVSIGIGASVYSPANNQLVLGTNDSERIRILSDGKVGVGTNTPAAKLTVSGNSDSSDEDCQIRIEDNDTNAGSRIPSLAFYASGTETGKIRGADISGMVFYTSGSERFTLDTSGNASITDGNLVVPSGHGIDFSATANSGGTATSELLDDYEEGTWTPTVFGNSTAGTFNIVAGGSNTGYYTKIGNYVTMLISWSNVYLTGAGGNLYIGNLPFSISASMGGSGGYVEYLEGFRPSFTKAVSEVDDCRALTLRYASATEVSFRPQYTNQWDVYVNAGTTVWQLDGGSASQRTYGALVLFGYTAT